MKITINCKASAQRKAAGRWSSAASVKAAACYHTFVIKETKFPPEKKKIKTMRSSLTHTCSLSHSNFSVIKITTQLLNIEFTDDQPITPAFDSFLIL